MTQTGDPTQELVSAPKIIVYEPLEGPELWQAGAQVPYCNVYILIYFFLLYIEKPNCDT